MGNFSCLNFSCEWPCRDMSFVTTRSEKLWGGKGAEVNFDIDERRKGSEWPSNGFTFFQSPTLLGVTRPSYRNNVVWICEWA